MTNVLGRLGLKLVLVSSLFVVTGCWSTSFTRTDRSFRPRSTGRAPEVFLDRRPLRPYHSVGIIEVKGPANDFDLDNVVDHAVERATELGCELVLDRSVHHGRSEGRVLYAGPYSSTGNNTTVNNYHSDPPPGRREFICAVYDDGGYATPAPRRVTPWPPKPRPPASPATTVAPVPAATPVAPVPAPAPAPPAPGLPAT